MRGYPAVLRCDNGPELACAAMAEWAGERVGLSFIPPSEPWLNGYIKSFTSRLRDEHDHHYSPIGRASHNDSHPK